MDDQDQMGLSGRRVLGPDRTGGVGEGIVRRRLAAGAVVKVPIRSQARFHVFPNLFGEAATKSLHCWRTTTPPLREPRPRPPSGAGVSDIDHGVAPIGGWWAGRHLPYVTENDWQDAFAGLATTHLAVLRATLSRIRPDGSYAVIVGDSASTPILKAGWSAWSRPPS